jgi:hypothetical protein
VADFLLKIALPGNTYTAPQVKQYLGENLSEANPIWYVGVYESEQQTNDIQVMLSFDDLTHFLIPKSTIQNPKSYIPNSLALHREIYKFMDVPLFDA